jgi:hypothetical protein
MAAGVAVASVSARSVPGFGGVLIAGSLTVEVVERLGESAACAPAEARTIGATTTAATKTNLRM